MVKLFTVQSRVQVLQTPVKKQDTSMRLITIFLSGEKEILIYYMKMMKLSDYMYLKLVVGGIVIFQDGMVLRKILRYCLLP